MLTGSNIGVRKVNLEILTLLIAALITAGFLWWIETADRNTKKKTSTNSKKKNLINN
jgi:hypothetical protein